MAPGGYIRTAEIREKNRVASIVNHSGYSNKGKRRSDEQKAKIRFATLMAMREYTPSEEARDKMRTAHRVWTGRKHSLESRQKISLHRKGKLAGAESTNWKGGITPLNKQIRASDAMKTWRKHVLQRDDYTCQACGQKGGTLHVDHELPFALYPDLRFEILNGRVLCVTCHRKTDTFAGKIRQNANFVVK